MGTRSTKKPINARQEYSGFAAAVLFMGLFVVVGITALIVESTNSKPSDDYDSSTRSSIPVDSTTVRTEASSVVFCSDDAEALEYTIVTAELNTLDIACALSTEESLSDYQVYAEAVADVLTNVSSDDISVLAVDRAGRYVVAHLNNADRYQLFDVTNQELRPITSENIDESSFHFRYAEKN